MHEAAEKINTQELLEAALPNVKQSPAMEKPTLLVPCYDCYPAWLKQFERFVLWRLEWDAKRDDWSKVPYQVSTHSRASSTNPEHWASFDAALAIYKSLLGRRDGFSGIGIVLGYDASSGLHLAGIDFDDCISPDRTTLPWVASHVEELEKVGHVEYSPSGTGIKAIVLARADDNLRNRSKRLADGSSIEVYGAERYFTQTGLAIGEAVASPSDATELLQSIQRERCGKRETVKATPEAPRPAGASNPPQSGGALSDDELLRRMFASRTGDRIRRLWDGDLSLHDEDHSRADAALASCLMWWTANDIEWADRLFRKSKLDRAKWDRQTAGTTYGRMTLEGAQAADGGYRGAKKSTTKAATVGGNASPGGGTTDSPPPYDLVTLSDVDPAPVRWLVPGYLPRGKVILFSGDGDTGKSSITNDIIAKLTTGIMPFGLPGSVELPPSDALIFALEDDPSDTLSPRLRAAEADMHRVHVFRESFDPRNTERLHATLDLKPEARLLVIDPIGSMMAAANVDGNKECEVRSVLDPLVIAAAERDLTVIIIAHTGKDTDRKAAHRTLGSVGITNVCRAVFSIARDTTSPTAAYFCPSKFNLGRRPPSLKFQSRNLNEDERELAMYGWGLNLTEKDRAELESQLFKIDWLGECDMTADELTKQHPQGRGEADKAKAAEWLAKFLQSGARNSDECVRAGNEAAGEAHADKWWREEILKKRLRGKCKPVREGGTIKEWVWEVPAGESTPLGGMTPPNRLDLLGILEPSGPSGPSSSLDVCESPPEHLLYYPWERGKWKKQPDGPDGPDGPEFPPSDKDSGEQPSSSGAGQDPGTEEGFVSRFITQEPQAKATITLAACRAGLTKAMAKMLLEAAEDKGLIRRVKVKGQAVRFALPALSEEPQVENPQPINPTVGTEPDSVG